MGLLLHTLTTRGGHVASLVKFCSVVRRLYDRQMTDTQVDARTEK